MILPAQIIREIKLIKKILWEFISVGEKQLNKVQFMPVHSIVVDGVYNGKDFNPCFNGIRF